MTMVSSAAVPVIINVAMWTSQPFCSAVRCSWSFPFQSDHRYGRDKTSEAVVAGRTDRRATGQPGRSHRQAWEASLPCVLQTGWYDADWIRALVRQHGVPYCTAPAWRLSFPAET